LYKEENFVCMDAEIYFDITPMVPLLFNKGKVYTV
jgi:hypothetical protein